MKQRLFALLLSASILLPWADSIGPRNGATVEIVGGAPAVAPWNDIHLVKNGDGMYAEATNNTFDPKDTALIRLTNFGFTVPANAAIKGVVIEVNRRGNGPGIFSTVDLAGISSTSKTGGEWPTVFQYESFGSPTDTFGATLTPVFVNSSTFGAQVVATLPAYSDITGTISARIEHIRMTVYYAIQAGMPQRTITISQTREHSLQKKAA